MTARLTTERTGMRRLAAVVLLGFVAAPLAAAPIAMQHEGFRPLTISNGIKVTQAFGPDDEDCVFETRLAQRPDGHRHISRKLVCDE